MPRGIYAHYPAQGFLHPIHEWEVFVGGISKHRGVNKRDAQFAFRRFAKLSTDPIGNASGKTVVLIKDGKQIDTFTP